MIARLEAEGWRMVRMRGSHCPFRHGEKPGTVTVVGALGVDVSHGTLRSILKQAGMREPT